MFLRMVGEYGPCTSTFRKLTNNKNVRPWSTISFAYVSGLGFAGVSIFEIGFTNKVRNKETNEQMHDRNLRSVGIRARDSLTKRQCHNY